VVDDKSDLTHLKTLEKLKMKYNFEFNINDKATNAGIYRNISLEKAKNNWITFANGDDYFIDGLYNKVSKYSNKELNTYFFLLQASI
jgi:hypothetical protein